ncbi:uncharacterized protein EI97DRAFT_458966 [Westerdykella ornata]|uniref:Uncharacterized protein n=1 Tax=Westerdykella ornata TaxID=318751 RepID=A0A6A6JHD8_WESOR|nr:uncharacterized protein EI97DRAFT_458966 [Westerdykella ornata]KAF2275971.1 hypothetical protein EI97DRAFT_458966 [Westerdykella ornata]
MSFNYVLGNINASFERLALYYRDFMERTEQAFRAMHQRLVNLEERQGAPSDEQVERVLRKILAERFADSIVPPAAHTVPVKEEDTFVKPKPNDIIPETLSIDVSSLQVDPDAVPSKMYGETLKMLEGKLPGFPNVEGPTTDED